MVIRLDEQAYDIQEVQRSCKLLDLFKSACMGSHHTVSEYESCHRCADISISGLASELVCIRPSGPDYDGVRDYGSYAGYVVH